MPCSGCSNPVGSFYMTLRLNGCWCAGTLRLGSGIGGLWRTGPPPQLPDDEVLEDLDDLEEPKVELADFPPEVRAIVEKSRRELLLATKTLTWKEIEQIDRQLVKDIAANYHPEAEQPLKEATLLDCLLSLSRMCESLSSLKDRKVISKVLDLRLSHLLKIKEWRILCWTVSGLII